MKRFLVLLLSLALLLSFASCGKKWKDPDYISDDITNWFDISLSDFTGGTYYLDLPNEITDADVQKELRWLQLYHARLGNDLDRDCYQGKPEFSDVVSFYYDLSLTPDGDSVFSNLFKEEGAEKITIGLWEFPQGKIEAANAIFDNKKFSDALQKTEPANRITEGVVESGDVVVLEYSVTNPQNVVEKSLSKVRIDTTDATLSLYEGVHPTAVLSHLVGKTIGEEYTVQDTFVPEGGSEAVTYTYKYKISYKVEETFNTVAITLAKDAFVDTPNYEYNAILKSLNGKNVYVRYSIMSYADYTPPKLNSSFYIDTLGLATDETDPAKVEQVALAAIKSKLEQQRLTEQVYPLIRNAVFDRIFERTDRVKVFPQKQVDKLYDELLEEVKASYEAEQKNYNFQYADLNDFTAAYFNYSLEEYPTAEDVCLAEAKERVTLRLLNFAIAQLAGINYSPEKCEEYYVTYLQYQIDGYTVPEYGIVISDEERSQIYATAGAERTDQLFEELLHLLVKYYSVYQQTTFTLDGMRELVGSKEDFLFEGLLSITEVNVQEYLYKNNTWIDTTP